jgi:hypothetical protein
MASVAVSDSGQPARHRVLVAGSGEDLAGQGDGGEVWRHQQGAAHLLEHDPQLGRPVPGSAVPFRHGDRRQPQLAGEQSPHLVVTALARFHQAADLMAG